MLCVASFWVEELYERETGEGELCAVVVGGYSVNCVQ
jgi:hypothetical protein